MSCPPQAPGGPRAPQNQPDPMDLRWAGSHPHSQHTHTLATHIQANIHTYRKTNTHTNNTRDANTHTYRSMDLRWAGSHPHSQHTHTLATHIQANIHTYRKTNTHTNTHRYANTHT